MESHWVYIPLWMPHPISSSRWPTQNKFNGINNVYCLIMYSQEFIYLNFLRFLVFLSFSFLDILYKCIFFLFLIIYRINVFVNMWFFASMYVSCPFYCEKLFFYNFCSIIICFRFILHYYITFLLLFVDILEPNLYFLQSKDLCNWPIALTKELFGGTHKRNHKGRT